MKYGHSCWGAHGKRSNIAPRELKPDDVDRWEIFKLQEQLPIQKPVYPFRKYIRENAVPQRFRYSDNDGYDK